MSYRPITDVWILARSKVKYYGAYPNGFLERALPLLGASDQDTVIHLFGGRTKDYPNRRLVQHAKTVDADEHVQPDYLIDLASQNEDKFERCGLPRGVWNHVLVDPPYTPADHEHYRVGDRVSLPTANEALRQGLQLAKIGGRVGVLHYQWPQPPKTARSIAAVAVLTGFNNRVRLFSVFEKE